MCKKAHREFSSDRADSHRPVHSGLDLRKQDQVAAVPENTIKPLLVPPGNQPLPAFIRIVHQRLQYPVRRPGILADPTAPDPDQPIRSARYGSSPPGVRLSAA